MGLFGKRKSPVASNAQAAPLATAQHLPDPTTDWSDLALVRNEWLSQLEDERQSLLGWSNGLRMLGDGVDGMQILNVAEYLTRGLAHHLFSPVLSEEDALSTCRYVLQLVDTIPGEPAFMAEYGPRLSRLALSVIREKGWQPALLGGDDSVTDEILAARHDGLVFYSAGAPGVLSSETWANFFRTR